MPAAGTPGGCCSGHYHVQSVSWLYCFSSCVFWHAILHQATLCQVSSHLGRHGTQTHVTKLAGILLLPGHVGLHCVLCGWVWGVRACVLGLHLCMLELTLQCSAKPSEQVCCWLR